MVEIIKERGVTRRVTTSVTTKFFKGHKIGEFERFVASDDAR